MNDMSPAKQAFGRFRKKITWKGLTVLSEDLNVCEDTVDVHAQKILDRKEAIAQAILDKGIESVGVIRAKESIAMLVGSD